MATPQRKVARLNRASRILKQIVEAIQDKKGEHVIMMDLRKIPEAVADYFIICEATSTTQVRAIADHVSEKVRESCGERPYHVEGHTALQWVIIDFVNVVVHVFLPETRRFYRLEEMWSDAVAEECEDPGAAARPAPAPRRPAAKGKRK